MALLITGAQEHQCPAAHDHRLAGSSVEAIDLQREELVATPDRDAGDPRGAVQDVADPDRAVESILLADVEEAPVRTQLAIGEQRGDSLHHGEASREGGGRNRIVRDLLLALVMRTGHQRVLADFLPADLVAIGGIPMTDAVRVQCDITLLPPILTTSSQFKQSAELTGRAAYPSTRGSVGGQDHCCEPPLQSRTGFDVTDIGEPVSEAVQQLESHLRTPKLAHPVHHLNTDRVASF
jgi:hypothetical protein